jgi:hypothetical protein
MRQSGKKGFLKVIGDVSTKTSVRDNNWHKQASPDQHSLFRDHFKRQSVAKKKRRRLQMMLEMKRMKESNEIL